MNEHKCTLRRISHQSCLPIGEVCGQEVDRERGAFFRAPARGYRPEQRRVGGDDFGESSPLRVAHNALAVAGPSSAKLASGDQRRLRRAGVAALRGHGVGKIDARGIDSHQLFTRAWGWLRNVTNLQDLMTRYAVDDDS